MFVRFASEFLTLNSMRTPPPHTSARTPSAHGCTRCRTRRWRTSGMPASQTSEPPNCFIWSLLQNRHQRSAQRPIESPRQGRQCCALLRARPLFARFRFM